MLFAAQVAFAQMGDTDIFVDKVEVKEVAGGNAWNVTVKGTIRLSARATKLATYTFCLYDPNNRQFPAIITPFPQPTSGTSVPFQFKPLGDPVMLRGQWRAVVGMTDDTGVAKTASKNFSVP